MTVALDQPMRFTQAEMDAFALNLYCNCTKRDPRLTSWEQINVAVREHTRSYWRRQMESAVRAMGAVIV